MIASNPGSSTSPAVKKQFSIPPYDKKNGLTDPGETCTMIEDAISEIYYFRSSSRLSFQELYNAVYSLCRYNHVEMLYRRLERKLKKHVLYMKQSVMTAGDNSFLEALVATWHEHRRAVGMICDFCMYMIKNMDLQKTSLPELARMIFGDHLLNSKGVSERVCRLTTEIIERERNGDAPPTRQLLKEVTQMMTEVSRRDAYEPCLEGPFLRSSQEHYAAEASILIQELPSPEYITRVFKRMEEERIRVERCLADTTHPKIEEVIKEKMLTAYATRLLDKEGSGAMTLLQDQRIADIGLLFHAMHIINKTQPLLDRIREHLLSNEAKQVTDPVLCLNPVGVVDLLIKQREKYDEFLDQAFSLEVSAGNRVRDKAFESEIRQAFVTIVNKNQRFAEFLAMAVDTKLRKKGVTEDECDGYFDKIIVLFNYLRDKDIFERVHKQHLAKRLLFSKAINEEGERMFISKLKTESGPQFTTKIEGMFIDMATSQTHTTHWKQHAATNDAQAPGSDLFVHVLTTGCWPFSNTSLAVTLPPEIKALQSSFHNFYLNSHTGRRLTWLFNMGTADVRYSPVKGRKYEMNVHTLQMLILLCFNDTTERQASELHELTNIPYPELKRQLLSLTIPTKVHQRVLSKVQQEGTTDKEFKPTTVFALEPNFSSKHVKFKVSQAVLKENEEQVKDTRAKVEEDRKWQLDAVIVRIMKARKSVTHSNLMVEVVNLVNSRFCPSPDDVKKRIESLIEREYIERSSESRSTYVYLA
ncbi:Cullin-3B [Diplonema papillatum]|nr:Cullin-3B [Diplonema papillatum]